MRRPKAALVIVVVLAIVVALLGGLQSGKAAFPGGNGKIVFHSNRDDGDYEIYEMDPDGTNQTNLTNSDGWDQDPAYSADGLKIVFDSARDELPVIGGDSEVYTMNKNGTNQTRCTPNDSRFDGRAVWSPDGSQIAFATNRDDPGDPRPHEVYKVDVSDCTTLQTNLTQNPADDHFPAWSPDGLLIAFQTDRDGNGEIYTMSAADGSGSTNRTNNPARDSEPAWSPDGTKIAFASDRDGNHEIYKMNADGSGQTRLTSHLAGDSLPAWSPDGTKIVFLSKRDGNDEIYVMNADGTCPTNLTNNPAIDEHPDWQPLGGPPPTPSAPLTCPKVGGLAELPEVAGTPLETGGSSGPGVGVLAGVVAAVTAGVIALGGAAWYARRRRFR